MVRVIKRWLGVDTLEARVRTLEFEVMELRKAPPVVTPPVKEGVAMDLKRYRWLHRLNEALRGLEG